MALFKSCIIKYLFIINYVRRKEIVYLNLELSTGHTLLLDFF